MGQNAAKTLGFVVVAATIGAAGLGAALAANGPFTKDQAEKGHVQFNNNCAQCHRPDLTGALGPSLVNDDFKKAWAGKPVAELSDWIHANMPQNAPGTLKDDQLYPIVAWIMTKNGVQAGDQPLSKDTAKAQQFPK